MTNIEADPGEMEKKEKIDKRRKEGRKQGRKQGRKGEREGGREGGKEVT